MNYTVFTLVFLLGWSTGAVLFDNTATLVPELCAIAIFAACQSVVRSLHKSK
jgi:uncharacterized membrane protein YcaP (DUF421 family)